MYLYDFINAIDDQKLSSNAKVVLNKDHPQTDFFPLNRLKADLNGKLDPMLYSATLAWNGNRCQQFNIGQTIVQLIQVSSQKYLLGSIATVTGVHSSNNPNTKYIYDLEKHTGSISDFYGTIMVDSTYVCNMAYQLKFDSHKEQFTIAKHQYLDKFPGYDKVNLTFKDLEGLIDLPSWKTALQNQKAVYLLRDNLTGKQYVGSAYGKEMLWQRWKAYISTGHGGDKMLIPLGKDYIKENFSFVILDTFNRNIKDDDIIGAESSWKEKLGTRKFGYNAN